MHETHRLRVADRMSMDAAADARAAIACGDRPTHRRTRPHRDAGRVAHPPSDRTPPACPEVRAARRGLAARRAPARGRSRRRRAVVRDGCGDAGARAAASQLHLGIGGAAAGGPRGGAQSRVRGGRAVDYDAEPLPFDDTLGALGPSLLRDGALYVSWNASRGIRFTHALRVAISPSGSNCWPTRRRGPDRRTS